MGPPMVPRKPLPARLDDRTPVRYGAALSISPTPAQVFAEPVQTVIGDAVPIEDVGFVVVDLETTGGSPVDDAITEIGAVRFQGVERVGSFQSLVDPGRPIPRAITHLTGISDRLVTGAPALEELLPSFLEFARGCVIVAHNASFDVGFLNASLLRLDYPVLPSPAVCTAKLARRLVWPDVPNVRLRTLAGYFRTRTQPTHRALEDAEATGEVFQGLLDVGQHLGIHTLGELYHACSARGRPNFAKIALAEDLPRAPGVYVFRDRNDQVLYVGKATDLRARVKSYFYGDERKKVQDLVASVARIEALPTDGELPALVAGDPVDREPPAALQRPGQALASLRLPQARSRRGLAPVEDRAGDRPRRRGVLPRPVRLIRSRDDGEGGARGGLPRAPVHARDGSAHAVRAVRAGGHGALPRAV